LRKQVTFTMTLSENYDNVYFVLAA